MELVTGGFQVMPNDVAGAPGGDGAVDRSATPAPRPDRSVNRVLRPAPPRPAPSLPPSFFFFFLNLYMGPFVTVSVEKKFTFRTPEA